MYQYFKCVYTLYIQLYACACPTHTHMQHRKIQIEYLYIVQYIKKKIPFIIIGTGPMIFRLIENTARSTYVVCVRACVPILDVYTIHIFKCKSNGANDKANSIAFIFSFICFIVYIFKTVKQWDERRYTCNIKIPAHKNNTEKSGLEIWRGSIRHRRTNTIYSICIKQFGIFGLRNIFFGLNKFYCW